MKVSQKLLAMLLAVALVAGLAGSLAACTAGSGTPTMPAEVKDFNSSSQVTGGVTFINYTVTVKASANWDSLSQGRQEAIVNYAFQMAWQRNAENSVTNYNIVGYSEATDSAPSVTLFMWDRENGVVILYTAGAQSGSMAAPQP